MSQPQEVATPLALYMVDTSSFTEMRRTYPRPPFDNVWELMERLAAEGRLLSIGLVLDELNAMVSLIQFRGHLLKGGYDGTHGIKQGQPASATEVHERVHGRRRPARVG